ncbi:hypothetical protein [Salipiger sp. PrR003]|uniref:hypothetical protein n=1 Tax=Salipiger sp. PrR003 TaxID=2706776 RepID=UPI0013DAEDB4|nr:hypothetical protein [Salipiger sp. PrR003]NDV50557.1 hypothetical protein [Salipiger sp. PrR003]
MTVQNEFAKMFSSIPNICNPDLAKGGMATAADYSANLSQVTLDAAGKSADVLTASTKETLGNMRALAEVREPSAYGEAFTGFMQAQMQLAQSTASALFEVAQDAGGKMGAVSAGAAEKAEETVTKTARGAAARKPASKAA